MSWYMMFDIYSKKKGSDWQNEFHCIEYHWLKNLTDTRGVLSSSISPLELDDLEYIALKKLTRNYDYHNFKYQGCLKVSDFRDIDVKSLVIETDDKKGGILVKECDLNKFPFISANDYMKFSDEEKASCVNIYTEEYTERGCGHGNFYSVSSFYLFRDKCFEKLKELYAKQRRWKEIKESFDYMKLNSEEKENVENEFLYLDEEIEEAESELISVNQFIGVMEAFGDFDKEVVAYIYSD